MQITKNNCYSPFTYSNNNNKFKPVSYQSSSKGQMQGNDISFSGNGLRVAGYLFASLIVTIGGAFGLVKSKTLTVNAASPAGIVEQTEQEVKFHNENKSLKWPENYFNRNNIAPMIISIDDRYFYKDEQEAELGLKYQEQDVDKAFLHVLNKFSDYKPVPLSESDLKAYKERLEKAVDNSELADPIKKYLQGIKKDLEQYKNDNESFSPPEYDLMVGFDPNSELKRIFAPDGSVLDYVVNTDPNGDKVYNAVFKNANGTGELLFVSLDFKETIKSTSSCNVRLQKVSHTPRINHIQSLLWRAETQNKPELRRQAVEIFDEELVYLDSLSKKGINPEEIGKLKKKIIDLKNRANSKNLDHASRVAIHDDLKAYQDNLNRMLSIK